MTSFPKDYIRKLSLNRSPFFSLKKIFNILEYPKSILFNLVIEWKEGEKVFFFCQDALINLISYSYQKVIKKYILI